MGTKIESLYRPQKSNPRCPRADFRPRLPVEVDPRGIRPRNRVHKGTHNTVADAISRLDFGPCPSAKENWMTFTKCWCHYTMQEESVENTSAHQEQMNLVFANHSKEDVIYPLTVREIAQAQKLDASLKKFNDQYSTQLVENTEVLCKDGKMVIPVALQHRAVSWYHHYLQHPGHTRLEETLSAAMYWKGMQNTIQEHQKPS